MQATALWYVKPGHAELREEEIAARKDCEVSVRALFGAISRGTERLVYCGGVPAAEVTLVDIVPGRAELARAVGARFAVPDAVPRECDLVFHASGKGEGLRLALTLAGEEASIIELSWYGSADISVPLGEAFHSRRL